MNYIKIILNINIFKKLSLTRFGYCLIIIILTYQIIDLTLDYLKYMTSFKIEIEINDMDINILCKPSVD